MKTKVVKIATSSALGFAVSALIGYLIKSERELDAVLNAKLDAKFNNSN